MKARGVAIFSAVAEPFAAAPLADAPWAFARGADFRRPVRVVADAFLRFDFVCVCDASGAGDASCAGEASGIIGKATLAIKIATMIVELEIKTAPRKNQPTLRYSNSHGLPKALTSALYPCVIDGLLAAAYPTCVYLLQPAYIRDTCASPMVQKAENPDLQLGLQVSSSSN